MGLTISGTQTVGVHLTSVSQNPVSVTSTGAIITTGSYAIYGSSVAAWTIDNRGIIGNHATYGYGIYLSAERYHSEWGWGPFDGVGLCPRTRGHHRRNGRSHQRWHHKFQCQQGHLFAPRWYRYEPDRRRHLVPEAGVYILGAAGGTFTNYGTVSAIGGGGLGVRVSNLVNGSSGDVNAQIYGQGEGALAGIVTNFGTISCSQKYGNDGVRAGKVVNGSNGDVTASILGASYYGVGSGTIFNYGTIAGAIGVRGISGSVNHSVIINGGSGDTSASISGSGFGIEALTELGANATVSNYGTIDGGSIGVSFGGYSAFGQATLTNAGTIVGDSGTAVLFIQTEARLIVHPGALFVGDVTASSTGDNALELGKGTGIGTIAASARSTELHPSPAGSRRTLGAGRQQQPRQRVAALLQGGVPLSVAGTLDVGGDLAMNAKGTLAMTGHGCRRGRGHLAPQGRATGHRWRSYVVGHRHDQRGRDQLRGHSGAWRIARLRRQRKRPWRDWCRGGRDRYRRSTIGPKRFAGATGDFPRRSPRDAGAGKPGQK